MNLGEEFDGETEKLHQARGARFGLGWGEYWNLANLAHVAKIYGNISECYVARLENGRPGCRLTLLAKTAQFTVSLDTGAGCSSKLSMQMLDPTEGETDLYSGYLLVEDFDRMTKLILEKDGLVGGYRFVSWEEIDQEMRWTREPNPPTELPKPEPDTGGEQLLLAADGLPIEFDSDYGVSPSTFTRLCWTVVQLSDANAIAATTIARQGDECLIALFGRRFAYRLTIDTAVAPAGLALSLLPINERTHAFVEVLQVRDDREGWEQIAATIAWRENPAVQS